MRGGVWGARWIDRESFHITLRFIGDIEDGLAHEIADALDGVVARPFRIRLKGVGTFGGNKPHALYVGVAAEGEDLKRLQANHERICQMLGLPAEQRKFTPHVTIARLKDSRLDTVHHYIASHNLYESPSVRGVELRSVLLAPVAGRRTLCDRGGLFAPRRRPGPVTG